MGQMNRLYNRTPFRTDRSLFLFRRGPSIPIILAALLFGGNHQVGCCGCGGRGFDSRGCFLLRLPSSPFRGSCGFFLRPGRLPGGRHYRLLGRLCDRLRRGIWMWVGGLRGGNLDDWPNQTTWFHPSSWSICSSEIPARRALGAAGWPVATLIRPRSVACFTRAAFASFHFTQPRYFAVWFPLGHSIEPFPAG